MVINLNRVFELVCRWSKCIFDAINPFDSSDDKKKEKVKQKTLLHTKYNLNDHVVSL